MRIVGRVRERVLGDRNTERVQEREWLSLEARRWQGRMSARRTPGEVSSKGVRACLRRAKRGDAALRKQAERALGVRREKGGKRFRPAPRIHDGLDGELRMELRRGADRGEHRVAIR